MNSPAPTHISMVTTHNHQISFNEDVDDVDDVDDDGNCKHPRQAHSPNHTQQ